MLKSMSGSSHLNPFSDGVSSTVANISDDQVAIASTDLDRNEKVAPLLK